MNTKGSLVVVVENRLYLHKLFNLRYPVSPYLLINSN